MLTILLILIIAIIIYYADKTISRLENKINCIKYELLIAKNELSWLYQSKMRYKRKLTLLVDSIEYADVIEQSMIMDRYKLALKPKKHKNFIKWKKEIWKKK